jgi:cell division septum initiation protein DivIVA
VSIELETGAEAWGDVGERRPNVAGDLPTLFRAAPMFARAVAGYDRFQVDTYVQWAEDELATAGREREHLVERCLRTQTALDDARERLGHSAGGGELLRVSRRIGALLAAAADEAEGIRAEALAERGEAAAAARTVRAEADRVLADAHEQARRIAARAATDAAGVTAEAGRVLAAAAATRRDAEAAAEEGRARLRRLEQEAGDAARRTGVRAAADAAAALLQARSEAVRLLGAGLEQRRRADEAAAADRDRLDREAAARRAALTAEVAELERRRAALRPEVELLAGAGTAPPTAPPWHRTRGRIRRRGALPTA